MHDSTGPCCRQGGIARGPLAAVAAAAGGPLFQPQQQWSIGGAHCRTLDAP